MYLILFRVLFIFTVLFLLLQYPQSNRTQLKQNWYTRESKSPINPIFKDLIPDHLNNYIEDMKENFECKLETQRKETLNCAPQFKSKINRFLLNNNISGDIESHFKKRPQTIYFLKENLLENANKELIYLFIYNVITSEGISFTLAEIKELLEDGKAIGEKSIFEHNEILGLHFAINYMKDVSRHKMILIEDILEIQRRVYAFSDPLFSIQTSDKTKLSEVLRGYIDLINSEEVRKVNPLQLAAKTLCKLKRNPITYKSTVLTKLVTVLILMKFGYPLVVIFEDIWRENSRLLSETEQNCFVFASEILVRSLERTLGSYIENKVGLKT